MIQSVTQLIEEIKCDLSGWEYSTKPWFRGESGSVHPLRPKIADYDEYHENHLLQSFRRQAGGLTNVPPRDCDDLWLFLAQHYGVPTRLLDWTEGALHALYFAINKGNPYPKVYMLNPRSLNKLAGSQTNPLNYPLSWDGGGALYVAFAWHNRFKSAQGQDFLEKRIIEFRKRGINLNLDVPFAFPATYQDQRMIAQRSCFTIHGASLEPMQNILKAKNAEINNYLFEYRVDENYRDILLRELSILGISASTIFPDLDHLADDLIPTPLGDAVK